MIFIRAKRKGLFDYEQPFSICIILQKCPGSELNRYGHCWPQDFKSCVSTNFTTRAWDEGKKNPPVLQEDGAEDRARTGHPDLGKVVLYQLSYFRLLCPGNRPGSKN